MKNSRYLVLFGALIVAFGVGVYYLNSPSHVNGKDVEGAIGAVEKHRVEQISASDVVLGDEQFKRETEALFAGYLKHAAELESRSASIAMFVNAVDMRVQNLESLKAELLSFEQNLESQWAAEQLSAIAMVEELMRMEQLASFNADLQLMQRDVQALSFRGAQNLENVEQLLARMTQSVESRAAEVATLERMVKDVQSMTLSIENRKANLESENLATFEANLEQMALDLQNVENLQRMEMIENRLVQLSAKARAFDLMSRARQEIEALSRLDSVSAEALASRQPQMLAISQELVAMAMQLENRAVANVESRMQQLASEAENLAGARLNLEKFSQSLEARAANLEARGVEQAVANLEQALASRNAHLESHASNFALAELAAINLHLENHLNLESRYQEALGVRQTAELQGRAENLLAQRGFVADLAAMEQHLASFSEQVQANRLVSVEARANLSSRAQELAAKAKDL
jgi:hypothetical protein